MRGAIDVFLYLRSRLLTSFWQGHRCVLVRPREQLVGRETAEKTDPVDGLVRGLASEQCVASRRERGHEGVRAVSVHQGRGQEASVTLVREWLTVLTPPQAGSDRLGRKTAVRHGMRRVCEPGWWMGARGQLFALGRRSGVCE